MEENRKESIFKKIENSILLQVVVFVVSMAVIVGCYVGMSGHVKKLVIKKTIREATVITDYDILMSVENVSTEDEVMTFSGWAMRLDSVTKNVHLVLKEVDGTEQIVLKAEPLEREEIEEYFTPGWEFGEVGFETTVKEKEVKKDTCYEIFLYLNYETEQEKAEGLSVAVEEGKKITSGMYLYNGELYRYDPTTFSQAEIKDELLENVMQEENLQFYSEDMGCWIYEKGNKLYFIVNDTFGLTDDRTRRIKYHTHTAQTESLAENRQEQGFDSRDFYFDEKEILIGANENYRVAVMDLPVEYAVSYVEIGLYESGVGSYRDIYFQLKKSKEK